MQRVNELLRRKITLLLLEKSKDPRFADVTITDVSVTQDTSRAEVYYSIIPPVAEEDLPDDEARANQLAALDSHKEEIKEALDGATGWLRANLAPTLRLRHVPELNFVYDDSLEHGARIEALLKKLREEE